MQEEKVEGFQLSPQQKHVWTLQGPDTNPAYRAQAAIRIEGDLDVATLTSAISRLVERHEILRTTFRRLSGMTFPLQVVIDHFRPQIPLYDLSSLNPDRQRAEIEALFQQARRSPFRFDRGPAFDVSLLTLSPFSHLLFVVLPALCCDRRSLGNLTREISEAYAACTSGEHPSDQPLQYADVAEWQNQMLESEETEAGREYWRGQDLIAVAEARFPFEEEPAFESLFDPESISLTVGPELAGQIQSSAREHGAATSAFYLACWQILLTRLTGILDLAVGVAYDGRNYGGLDGALGLFQRYLPISCGLEQGHSFSHVLRQLHERTQDAYQWQEYFRGGAAEGDEPSFIAAAFEPCEASPSYSASGLTFSIHTQCSYVEQFKVKLAYVEGSGDRAVELHYDARLYRVEDMKRLAGQFCALLESAAARPGALVWDLELLSPCERQQLLMDFNNTKQDYPRDKCIHEMFERQAAAAPDRIALVFEGQHESYGQLNERANQLAHYLQELGVQPDEVVATHLERSVEMVVGMLAVLKAGGAYLPLDPEYPKQRLAFMAADAQAPVILTQRRLAGRLGEQTAQVVCLDTDWEEFGRQSKESPDCLVNPENLAYVIYTSGSTGAPKGVMITHAAIGNRLLWMQKAFPMTERDCLLQKTPFSFDASVWEFYAPLLAGARVVMARPGGHQDAAYMVEAITEQMVTTLQLVPSMLRVLVEEPGVTRCTSLERVFSGGEALTAEVADRFLGRLSAGLKNLYGPTEASIDASCYECEGGKYRPFAPLGRPIGNMQIHVLDAHLQPVATGVGGELHIGGVGLARGYLKRPELTAEKFIPNRFGHEPGARLYKSGDMGQYLRDGALAYLGRRDQQVKIRGHRIETGEIEEALNRHPAVGQAVVEAREDAAGRKSLVAYIVPNQEGMPTTMKLRSFLLETLPDYMTPSAYVALTELPLTPNGKLDRRALPAPEQGRPGLDGAYRAARSLTEGVVSGIWAQVLGLEQVSIDDNFFDLGGDSLLATQVVSRVREGMGLEVSLRGLFERPTVAGLAQVVEGAMKSGQPSPVPPIEPIARDRELPLSFAQQRLWFIYRLDPDTPAFNIPLCMRLKGRLNVAALEQTLGEIVRRHEVLRTSYGEVGGEPVQVISSDLRIGVRVAELGGVISHPDGVENLGLPPLK